MISKHVWIVFLSYHFFHKRNFSKLLLVSALEFCHEIAFDVFQMLVKTETLSDPSKQCSKYLMIKEGNLKTPISPFGCNRKCVHLAYDQVVYYSFSLLKCFEMNTILPDK